MSKGFRILADDDGPVQPNVFVIKDERSNNTNSGFDHVLNNFIGEQLKKALDGKKEEKKEDKPKTKTFSKAEVSCWSLLLLFTAPWTGLWLLNALEKVKLEWMHVLNAVPK